MVLLNMRFFGRNVQNIHAFPKPIIFGLGRAGRGGGEVVKRAVDAAVIYVVPIAFRP